MSYARLRGSQVYSEPEKPGFHLRITRKRIIAIGIVLLLVWLSTGFFSGPASVWAATWNNATFSHSYTQIYSGQNTFGSGTGGALQNWNFNNTLNTLGNPVCVSVPSSQQMQFKYDVGKTSTSFGPFQFAATDTGNGIDLQQQQKIFFAQNNWWVFYMNSTGTNANKIIFTASKTGSNATGSWRAGGTFAATAGFGAFAGQTYSATTYNANAAEFATWNNATHVFLVFRAASFRLLDFVVGTLNTNGQITFGTVHQVADAGGGSVFNLPQVIVYNSAPFTAVVITSLSNSTTVNNMVAYYSTASDYSAWSSAKILHAATGGQITHTAWYNQPADLMNGSLYLAYSSSNGDNAGVVGSYGTLFTRGTSGNFPTTLDSFSPTITGGDLFWGTAPQDFGNTFTLPSSSDIIQSISFRLNQTVVHTWTGSLVAQIYGFSGTPGTNAIPVVGIHAQSTNSITNAQLTTVGPAPVVTFNFNNVNLPVGTYFAVVNASSISGTINNTPLIWKAHAYAGHNGAYYIPPGPWAPQPGGPDNYLFTVTGLADGFGPEETIANSNNIAWFPYGTTGTAPNSIVMAFVNGSGSNLNQIFLYNERVNGVWKYANNVLWPLQSVSGVPTADDLSSGAIWDGTFHQYYYINQLTNKFGISGWWNSSATSNPNGWTNMAVNSISNSNMTTFFQMSSPTDGNVSSRFNRMNQALKPVIIGDGTYRTGVFWTEGTAAGPVSVNYRLVFGSILMPHGQSQPGNNCASADIAITNTALNLQAASGKQLAIFWSWDCSSNGVLAGCLDTHPDFASVNIELRTNKTLPSWTENYDPLKDPTVRFYWQYAQLANGELASGIYMAHDSQKSIFQEGLSNDLVISLCNGSGGGNPSCVAPTTYAAGNTINFGELILNYTGPNLDLAMATQQNGGSVNPSIEVDTTVQANAQLQQGVSYYLMVKATWGTALAPAAGEVIDFRVGDQLNTFFSQNANDNIHPTTTSLYSVPPVCSDPSKASVNTCAATQQSFFNPLDPSSWANSVIKGLEYLFLTVLPPAFVAFESFLATALNVIGSFFGFTNFGTTLFTLVNQFVLFFTNDFPAAVANQTAVFARYFDSLTILFAWVPLALGIASYLLTLGINSIAFLILATQDIFLIWNAMIIIFLFLFWFADVGEYGISGFLAWFETMKFLVFGLGIGPLLDAIHYGLQIILLLVGIIPKPFVQMAATLDQILPKIHVNGNPTWPSFNMDRLRNGDYFSVMGFLLGMVVLVWFETTNLPGSITALVPGVGVSLTRLASFNNLMLLWLEIAAMVGIFVLPAQLFKSVGANLPGFNNLSFQRGAQIQGGKVSAGAGGREPSKLLLRAQKKLGQTKIVAGRPEKVGPETEKEVVFREAATARKAELAEKLEK